MKYDGNYCGPNWSAGKQQGSTIDMDVDAMDEFDATCQSHDAVYAVTTTGDKERSYADREFYRLNVGRGYKRSAAAMGVITQSFVRDLIGYDISGGAGQLYGKKLDSRSMQFIKRLKQDNFLSSTKNMRGKKRRSVSSKKSYRVKTTKGKKGKRKYISKKKQFRKKSYRKSKKSFKKKWSYRKGNLLKSWKAGLKSIHETRGLVTDPKAVYLGHGLASNKMIDQFFRLIVKELYTQAGFLVQSFDLEPDQAGLAYSIITYYRINPAEATVANFGLAIAPNQTYGAIATAMRLSWEATFSANDNIMITEIRLDRQGVATAPAVPYDQRGIINFQFFKMKFKVTSILNIQNATKGLTNEDENSDEALTRNPLLFRRYLKYGQNGFFPAVNKTEVGFTGFWPDDNFGLIASAGSTNVGQFGGKKLLPLTMIGAKAGGQGIIGPGVIRRDIQNMYMTFTGQYFLNCFWRNIAINASAYVRDQKNYVKGNKVSMYGFEKVLNAGGENDLRMYYELEQHISASYSYRVNNYTAPILINI